MMVYNSICFLNSLQHFKERLNSSKEADHLQPWFEQRNEPHYRTVFTEFVPSDTTDSWQFVVRENEDYITTS